MSWTTEEPPPAEWGEGAVWQLGEVGIWLGMGGLRLGVGYPHRQGTYSDESLTVAAHSDESVATGAYSDETPVAGAWS